MKNFSSKKNTPSLHPIHVISEFFLIKEKSYRECFPMHLTMVTLLFFKIKILKRYNSVAKSSMLMSLKGKFCNNFNFLIRGSSWNFCKTHTSWYFWTTLTLSQPVSMSYNLACKIWSHLNQNWRNCTLRKSTDWNLKFWSNFPTKNWVFIWNG